MDFRISDLEKKLIEKCLSNDRLAQKYLYDKYKDAMYTLAYRIFRNETLACDALQDGFIEVFNNLEKFEGRSTLGAWIKTIIIRKCLKNKKMEKNYEPIDDNYDEMVCCWDDDLTGEELDRAINMLSPGYRCIFTLIEIEGYSHKEVSTMLEISEGTSKSQLSRAKLHLQESLKHLRN